MSENVPNGPNIVPEWFQSVQDGPTLSKTGPDGSKYSINNHLLLDYSICMKKGVEFNTMVLISML